MQQELGDGEVVIFIMKNKPLSMQEDLYTEFKTSFNRTVIETLGAFANTCGGKVYLGIDNNGNVTGIEIGRESIQNWLNEIKNKTYPVIIPDVEVIEIENKKVIMFSIEEYPIKPVAVSGKYYKRVANSNHIMTIEEVSDLYLKTYQLSWDSYAANEYNISDLDMEKIEKFIHQVNQGGKIYITEDPITALTKLKFIIGDKPSYASILLFVRHPMRYNIHIGRFKTEIDIIDDIYITDTLFEAVNTAMDAIKKHLNVRYEIKDINREEIWEIPMVVLRESLLNSIVHRDYRNSNDIVIKIYDDKIEFISPGKLWGGITIKDLTKENYAPSLRNKLIAEAFF